MNNIENLIKILDEQIKDAQERHRFFMSVRDDNLATASWQDVEYLKQQKRNINAYKTLHYIEESDNETLYT